MTTGADLLDQGTADVLAAETAAHRVWLDHAQDSLGRLIASGTEWSCGDVRDGIPAGLEPRSPNSIGALIASAARDGLITRVYDTRSPRRTRHNARVGVWTRAVQG